MGMLPLLPLASTAIVFGSFGLLATTNLEQSPEHFQSSVEFSGTSIEPTDFVPIPEKSEAELTGAVDIAAVTVTVVVGPAAVVTVVVRVTVVVELPHPATATRTRARRAIRSNRALVDAPVAHDGKVRGGMLASR
jgi:hypothetical protein